MEYMLFLQQYGVDRKRYSTCRPARSGRCHGVWYQKEDVVEMLPETYTQLVVTLRLQKSLQCKSPNHTSLDQSQIGVAWRVKKVKRAKKDFSSLYILCL